MAIKDAKIPINISDIRRRAQKIASETGEKSESVEKKLIESAIEVGLEIDHIPEDQKGDLDLTGPHKFGPNIVKPPGTPSSKS